MKKLAAEMAGWPEELGESRAEKCLRQVREYLNSPQDAEGSHLTAGRDRYIVFLQEAQQISGLDFSRAVDWLCQSMDTVLGVAAAIQ